jgi:hypothetical protein
VVVADIAIIVSARSTARTHLRADVGRFAYGRSVAAFVCRLGHGPAWDDTRGIREKDGRDNHAKFMDSLVADRFIVVGGPVRCGDFTAHLVEAADEQEIRNRLAEDPWAIDAHPTVESVEPWSLWLDGRHTRSSTNDDAGGAHNQ